MLVIKQKRFFAFCCLPTFFAITFNVAAENGVAKVDDDLFFSPDIPIVLSATRLAQPQSESPATITIIDRDMIKFSGAKEVAEVFRLVPGMHVGHFRGNRPVVAYQGLSSEYPQGVQVLIDGRSVYSPLFGGVDWSNIPVALEDIEKIEIIRGANGSSFGSNAFQAVINITTVHPIQLNGFQVKNTIGEEGYQRTLLKGGFSLGDIDVRLTGSHLDDNGFKNNDDDTRQDLLTARIDYQITTNDHIQVNLGVVNSLKETHTPGTLLDPFDPPRHVDESNYSAHVKWEHATNNNHLFITQASYTRHLSKDKVFTRFNPANAGFAPLIPLIGTDVITNPDYTNYYDRYDIEIEHQFKPLHTLRVSWGLGSRNDRVYQPFWMNSKQLFDNSIQRVFSNIEWRPSNKFIINTGALWEHSQLSGDEVSSRVAINYLVSPTQSFRLSASRAFRAPVLAENNFDAQLALASQTTPGLVLTQSLIGSEGGLDSETVDSIELGYHGLFINNTLTVDLKLFHNEYDNFIDTKDQVSDAVITLNDVFLGVQPIGEELKVLDNFHHADINGYEVELNYRPNADMLLHLGYAYNHANVGSKSNVANDVRNVLNSIPKDNFNLLVSRSFSNDSWVSSAFYYTSSMEYLDSGNPQGPMRRLDLNAGKRFKLSQTKSLDINVTLQLALDKNIDFLREFNVDNRAFIEAQLNLFN